MSSLGSRIRVARKRAGFLKIRHLAEKLDVDATQVSRWEHDHATPRVDALDRIAELCGVSIDWLVRGSVDATAPEAIESDAA